jgi:uncharacterized protein YqgV (UPF0045/DUF77 family)
MHDHTINLALQILPQVVDEAIAVIHNSGVKYRVCPFETVMEGTYDQLMEVVKQAQEVCFKAGAGQILVFMKIQNNSGGDVSIEDKTGKYD